MNEPFIKHGEQRTNPRVLPRNCHTPTTRNSTTRRATSDTDPPLRSRRRAASCWLATYAMPPSFELSAPSSYSDLRDFGNNHDEEGAADSPATR